MIQESFPQPADYGYDRPPEQAAFYRGLSIGMLAANLLMTTGVVQAHIETQEIARYDEKTGALTEAALVEEIARDQLEHPHAPRGLLFIDLGNFKKANVRGQHEGDDVLRMFGTRLQRLTDRFARASDRADEFIVYLDLESRGGQRDPEDTLQFEMERLQDARDAIVKRYPHMDEGRVRFFVGIGGAMYDHDMDYQENRRLANNEMLINKALDHQEYGKYRIAEE